MALWTGFGLVRGQEGCGARLHDNKQARKSLDFRQYIFVLGECTGWSVRSLLCGMSHVRIVVEWWGVV